MSRMIIGIITQGGWNFAPRGFAMCNGQLLSIAQNPALFALLGTTFGGDGQTTFGLPNLQSRSMMQHGQGLGLSNVVIGEAAGTETVTLTQNQMPQHTHTGTFNSTSTFGASDTSGTRQAPGAGTVLSQAKDGGSPGTAVPLIYLPTGTATNSNLGGLNVAGTVTNGIAGGSQPVDIRNPYLGITHVIAVEGIFPSRN